ncbi:hypothetical protein [Vibrio litoralis]|uniref:hypothetical protein n=1 Tax=Vibrio litoralis TaxID=335972 RepID=UPI00042A5023|nr:hypothetical protein [Vibrio litoralis]
MKVQFFAAYRRSGVSKKNNRAYDFAQLSYAVPLREINSESFNQSGVGFEIKEIPLANHVINEFDGIELGTPVELKVTPNPEDPTRNICIGLA